jgi:CspA family cold shock protein
MRQRGTVKFFHAAKGYGFITPDDGGKDVFVHITAVQRSGIPELAEGTKLSFELQPDPRGRGVQAVSLQLLPD